MNIPYLNRLLVSSHCCVFCCLFAVPGDPAKVEMWPILPAAAPTEAPPPRRSTLRVRQREMRYQTSSCSIAQLKHTTQVSATCGRKGAP